MLYRKRLVFGILWGVLGAALMGLCLFGILDSSLYSGMGGALIVVGALQIIRGVKYKRDPDYREKVETEMGDERNRFLSMKSWSWTGYLVVLIEAAGSIVAMVLGQQMIQQALLYSICLIVCIYWISYLILSRKY